MDSTYILLQHYWWFLVSLLGALLVFLLFVQGGQSLLFHDRQNRIATKDVAELDRTQMGVYVYDPGHFRRCVLRLFPVILFDQFRRSLLGVDADTGLLRSAGRIV